MLVFRPVFAAHESNAGLCELREHHVIEQLVLLADDVDHMVPQYVEYLLSRQRLRSLRESAELHPLFQGGDADLEEFIEVGAGDAEKTKPLE